MENLPREGEHSIPADSRPRQYEFARGNLDYTVMSKRKLLELVKGGHVSGWDDPRMPTLAGLRRRGVTPEAIRAFWERMGVARTESRRGHRQAGVRHPRRPEPASRRACSACCSR